MSFGTVGLALYGTYRAWAANHGADFGNLLLLVDTMSALPLTIVLMPLLSATNESIEKFGLLVYIGAGITWTLLGGFIGFQIDYFKRRSLKQ